MTSITNGQWFSQLGLCNKASIKKDVCVCVCGGGGREVSESFQAGEPMGLGEDGAPGERMEAHTLSL